MLRKLLRKWGLTQDGIHNVKMLLLAALFIVPPMILGQFFDGAIVYVVCFLFGVVVLFCCAAWDSDFDV